MRRRGEEPRRARGHPAGPAGGRGGAGRRRRRCCGPPPSTATAWCSTARPLTAELVRAAIREACAGDGRPRAGRHHGRERLVGRRPRSRLGPPPGEPADRDRPLAARRGLRLLGRHDPHVRRRRGVRRGRGAPRRRAGGRRRRPRGRRPGRRRAAPSTTRPPRSVEAAGHPTLRTRAPGETLTEGFYFSLGHGVGLEIHEPPILGLSAEHELVAGDVIAIEPGIEGIPGIGGVRVEDLLLVTDDGAETLTDYPYGLTP